MEQYPQLFSPIRINRLELKNRIMMGPLGTGYAGRDGLVNDTIVDYYVERAKGGVGLVFVEASAVDETGRSGYNSMVLYGDDAIPGLERLASSVHAAGGAVAVQLAHCGRQGRTEREPVAPSPIPCPVIGLMPRELTPVEIEHLVHQYVLAARRAKNAGFDAVEVHGAHGYLLNEFLSPYSNKRTDEYGGSVENRRRFPLAVVDAVRAEVGDDYPVTFRLSADEYQDGGMTIADTVELSKVLVDHGIDCINVSGGTYSKTLDMAVGGPKDPPGLFVPFADAIKKAIGGTVPVAVANLIRTGGQMEEIIQSGNADIVVSGRGLLADPYLPAKLREGRDEDVDLCINCKKCSEQLMGGNPIRCVVYH